MTTAPKYPLEHTHSGENPFDIIDSAWGSIERWRAQALATGELGALTVLSKHVKNDSIARMDAVEQREAALSARQDALDQRERNLGVLAAQVTDFVGKASVLFDRLHKLKADAEAEPEELPLPPGHSSELPDPALNADASLPGDPSAAASASALTPEQQERDFAAHLRLNHPIARDQDDPPVGGIEFPTEPLPKPPELQQPTGEE